MPANFIIRRPHTPVLTRRERKKAKETRAWALSAREKLINAASKRKQYEDEIKEMYGLLLKEKAAKSLHDIPIDKLNEKKDGIKINLLKSNGVNTVGDAYDLGDKGLKSINGIGDVSLRLIQENIFRIYNVVAAETKVSLTDITDSHETGGRSQGLISPPDFFDAIQTSIEKRTLLVSPMITFSRNIFPPYLLISMESS